MAVEWTREQTVRLIRSLKKQEILWNSRSKSYKDRKKKTLAWISVESEVGESVEACKRRVESLLASCRREKNKIMKSKSVDEPEFVYVPKWIYWKEFKFLRAVPDEILEEQPCDEDLDLQDLSQPIAPQWSPSARRPPRKRKRVKEIVKLEENNQWPIVQTKFHWDGDEHDAFGITVAAKLRKMDPNQRLFAENIINQALYKGMLFQLSAQSETEFMQPPRIQHSQSTNTQPQPAQEQWHTHNFTPVPVTYDANKTNNISMIVQNQVRRDSTDDFKQLNRYTAKNSTLSMVVQNQVRQQTDKDFQKLEML